VGVLDEVSDNVGVAFACRIGTWTRPNPDTKNEKMKESPRMAAPERDRRTTPAGNRWTKSGTAAHTSGTMKTKKILSCSVPERRRHAVMESGHFSVPREAVSSFAVVVSDFLARTPFGGLEA
jgi:hypothetical protein